MPKSAQNSGILDKDSPIILVERYFSAAKKRIIVAFLVFIYTEIKKRTRRCIMFKPKYRFTYDEIRIIVMALVELKNQLISEGRYTDAVDDLLIKFVD